MYKESTVSEKDVNRRSGAVTRSSWVSMAIVSGMAIWLFSGDFTAEPAGASEAVSGLATSPQKAQSASQMKVGTNRETYYGFVQLDQQQGFPLRKYFIPGCVWEGPGSGFESSSGSAD